MRTNFSPKSSIQIFPHQPEQSSTLEIGSECLENTLGLNSAFRKYQDHSVEIVLTSIFNEFARGEDMPKVFEHVLELIKINDRINFQVQ